MPHHGHHHGRSNDKNDHDRKKSDNDGHRQKTNRPSYLSYLDDHEPGKTTHPQFLDELPKNKLHRYHPKELSYLLQQNSNRRKISQLSATAQHRLKRPVRVCSRGSDVQKLVEEWLPVLDEIFFFSTVGPHLKMAFICLMTQIRPKPDSILKRNLTSRSTPTTPCTALVIDILSAGFWRPCSMKWFMLF